MTEKEEKEEQIKKLSNTSEDSTPHSLSIGKALKRKITREDEFEVVTEKKTISESILMNPVRRRIYETLFLYPCIYLTALCEELSIKQPTAVWHLKKLSENNFIEELESEGRKIYYPKDMLTKDDIPILSNLNFPNVRSIFREIVNKPGISKIELANTLSLKYNIVTHNISKLLHLGLISKLKDGKEIRYYPTELFSKREEIFRIRMKGFRELIIKRLANDGLQPKIEKRSDSELLLRILSGGNVSFLHLYTKPFYTLLAKE